jgi:hypothetical protein
LGHEGFRGRVTVRGKFYRRRLILANLPEKREVFENPDPKTGAQKETSQNGMVLAD